MLNVRLEWSPAAELGDPRWGELPEVIPVPALPYEGTVIEDLPDFTPSVEVDFIVYNAQRGEFTLFVIEA